MQFLNVNNERNRRGFSVKCPFMVFIISICEMRMYQLKVKKSKIARPTKNRLFLPITVKRGKIDSRGEIDGFIKRSFTSVFINKNVLKSTCYDVLSFQINNTISGVSAGNVHCSCHNFILPDIYCFVLFQLLSIVFIIILYCLQTELKQWKSPKNYLSS